MKFFENNLKEHRIDIPIKQKKKYGIDNYTTGRAFSNQSQSM